MLKLFCRRSGFSIFLYVWQSFAKIADLVYNIMVHCISVCIFILGTGTGQQFLYL